VLGRSRWLACGATVVLAAGVAGCAGAATTNSTVTGSTLTIYSSEPAGIAGTPHAQDVLAAEKLALDQAGGQVGHFKIKLNVAHGDKTSDNARSAIEDTNTIAYLGELAPGSSADSIGITNGGHGLLEISPTDTAIALTQTSPVVKDSPGVYYQSLKTNGRTFGRVVPASVHEATALVTAIKQLHVTKLYVTDDGGDYGKAIAFEVARDAGSQGVSVVKGPPVAANVKSSGAGAVFVGASSEALAAKLFNDVAVGSPKAKLFGASALNDNSFASALSPSAQANTYISSPGFMPGDLTQAGRKFVTDFRAAYGHEPVPSAIFGYEAMSLVLDVLRRAGAGANNPSTVVSEFHNTKNRNSDLGTYTISASGDTSLTPAPYVLSHFKAGKLVPYESLQA
jgi:branched-chain amino acid transport system substrate-binding protein